MTIPKIPWKTISVQLSRHAPSILTGVGIGGFITATVMAAKATPKYMDDRRLKRVHITENLEPLEKLPLKEEALLVGKHYWPTAVVVGTSAACIIFANHMNLQRQAALAAACSVSETMLKNYKAKAIEVLGCLDEGFEDAMTVMVLPMKLRKKLRTSNHIERLNKELKRRSKVIDVFPNQESLIRLMGAVLLERNEKHQIDRHQTFFKTEIEEIRKLTPILEQIAHEQQAVLVA